MKSLRRSLNNNGSSSSQPSPPFHYTNGNGHGTVPSSSSSSSPMAFSQNPISRPSEKIAPPQKVIKALLSHKSTNPQELSYTKGDFWYVTGERDGWYEALNPLTGSRGLVPMNDFEEFTKGGRPNNQHQRQQSQQEVLSSSRARTPSAGQIHPDDGSKTLGAVHSPHSAGGPPRKGSSPLYAIVQYDFHAERPDELEAKAGEPIVVIAQSNHEWFVAKPIGRLGGPGLIPVAFVEIRDPVTGKPIEVSPSSVPQVEVWKKQTAEYKAAAIPLGRFDLPPDQAVVNSPYAAASSSQMNRGAPGSASQASLARTTSTTSVPRSQSAAGGATGGNPSAPIYRPEHDAFLPPGDLTALGVPSFHNESGNYWFRLHASFTPDERTSPSFTLTLYRTYEDFYEFQITLLDTFPAEAGRTQPGQGDRSPPERILPYMPGPVDEEIDDELTEYRREELDAYVKALLDLRNQGADYILRHELIRSFFAAKYGDYCEAVPRRGGGGGGERIEEIEERMADVNLDNNIQNNASARSGSSLAGSYSAHPYAQMSQDRTSSSASRHSERSIPVESPQPWNQPSGSGHSRTHSRSHSRSHSQSQQQPPRGYGSRGPSPLPPIDTQQQGYHSSSTRPDSSSYSANDHHYTSPITSTSTSTFGPGMKSPYGQSQTFSQSNSSSSHHQQQPISASDAGGGNPPYIKIKIYDRATDDLIAIRVHPNVSHSELLDKVRARLGDEIGILRYRAGMGGSGGSGGTGGTGGGGTYRDIKDDRDLRDWIKTEDQKLVLYAEQG